MRALALVLVLGMTPSMEVFENVVHLVTEGHLAHARHDHDHTPRGAEHGCSGTFHVCSCHHAPVFLPVAVDAAEASEASARPPIADPRADVEEFRSRLLRPPIV